MIDTLVAMEPRFRARGTAGEVGWSPGSSCGDASPPGARGLRSPRPGHRRSRGGRPGASVVFPVHPRTRRALDGSAPGARHPPVAAARVLRLPVVGLRRRGGAYRLGRRAGGDDLPARSVLHPPRQHGAPGHHQPRLERPARTRSGAHPRASGASPRAGRCPQSRRRCGTAERPSAWPTCSRACDPGELAVR